LAECADLGVNPEISTTLRDRKLGHLDALQPKAILSANVGCITHLQSGTEVPVKHWVEVLDVALGWTRGQAAKAASMSPANLAGASIEA
jgi:hypothetical protein